MRKLLPTLLVLITSLFADCLKPNTVITNNSDMLHIIQCLQDEINEIKKSKYVVKVNVIDDLPKPSTVKSTTVSNVKFDLDGCFRNKTTVKCELKLTNQNDNDFSQSIYNGIVYDEYGQDYKVSSISILKKPNGMSVDMLSKVPIRAQLIIDSFPETSTQLTAIKFYSSSGKVIFKSIAIQPESNFTF